MGIGMQIVYLGFCGTSQLEAEAASQLVRLNRFCALVPNCHLAIEAVRSQAGSVAYDVRLDLITPAHDLWPIGHCAKVNPEEAVRCAFDAAEQWLQAATDIDRRQH
jgi:hypothetical protein